MGDEQCHSHPNGRGNEQGDRGCDERTNNDRVDVGEEPLTTADIGGWCAKGWQCLNNKEQGYGKQHGNNQRARGQGRTGENLVSNAARPGLPSCFRFELCGGQSSAFY